MAYSKQNFKGGNKLYASQLNAMDEQISKNENKLEELSESVDGLSDALSEITKTQYETVDSASDMTDTSKMYILSSTNTLWAYGESGEPIPNFTNLADPSSEEWLQNHRCNSTGVKEAEGLTVTNLIEMPAGSVLRITGIDLEATVNGETATQQVQKTRGYIFSTTKIKDNPLFYTGKTNDIYTFENTDAQTIWYRFSGAVKDGDENVVITIHEEITYSKDYAWYDTGLPAESAAGGVNYIRLLEKINENKAGIADVSDRVTALEADSDTAVIPAFWQSAVDTCISKIKALQVGRNCVTFPFFSDNHTRDGATQYMGILIAHIMRECGIPYCFYGGDAITSAMASTADSDAEFREQAAAFARAMSYIPDGRFCMTLGNHETWLVANPNIEGSVRVDYDRDQTYEIFLREEGTAQNKHFGGDGTYYYVDDIASRVRFIILNTNGIDNSNIDEEQLAWLCDTALRFSESGWAAVIFSHIPITNHYEQSNIPNAAEVVAAVNASGVDIIGWFSGHIHRDRIYTGMSVNDTDDTVGDPLGFTQVTITSDHTAIAYPIGQSPTTHVIDNSDKSHAIDFVTVNRDTRTVNLTRLGIGEDRSYTY